MVKTISPGAVARRAILCTVLGGLAAAGLVSSQQALSAEPASVGIDNFTFAPKELTIAKGTEVTWTNHDDIPHSIVIGALQIHSKPMDTDGLYTYKFEKAGTFFYVCGLHPHMMGKVIVK